MAGRARPGPVPLVAQREWLAALISQGVSNSEACRTVGINRRTGTRWRFGRSIPASSGRTLHYPAVVSDRLQTISARYLSEDERIMIADLNRVGVTVRAIAGEVGRSPSTISRELRRNRDDAGRYRPLAAHRLAAERRSRPRDRRVVVDVELREFVQGLLTVRRSPEQISHALHERFVGDPSRQLVAESVYQALYDRDSVLLRDRSCVVLRTGRRRRRPHRQPDARRAGSLAQMTMIDQRPASAEDRVEPGHWEGDLIMGKGNNSATGTLVERTSRKVVLIHLGGDKSAIALRDALIDVFGAMSPTMRRSRTWDQGKEMAGHLNLTRAIGLLVYFCDAHSPWQRGSNETMNGLLRDYFPKHTDLRHHSVERLTAVADELNRRPRM
jgi:transposase, IS30 family